MNRASTEYVVIGLIVLLLIGLVIFVETVGFDKFNKGFTGTNKRAFADTIVDTSTHSDSHNTFTNSCVGCHH